MKSQLGDIPPSKVAQAKFEEGLVLHQCGQLAQAQEFYRQSLTLQPNHFEALHLLGVIAVQQSNFKQAFELISKSIEINPRNAVAYANLGNALTALGQYQAAIGSYDKAITLEPDFAGAHASRSIAFKRLKEFNATSKTGQQSAGLNSMALAKEHFDKGNVSLASKQYQAAVDSFDKAIAVWPNAVAAYINRGLALNELKQHQAAIDSYDLAISILPRNMEAHFNRGLALYALNQREAAIESYNNAIVLRPDVADTHYNRGIALADLKQHQDAFDSFDRALTIKPDFDFLYGTRLNAQMTVCNWNSAEVQISTLILKVQQNQRVSFPFSMLALSDSLKLQAQVAKIFVNHLYPANLEIGSIAKRPRGQKIRLGYFSADFHNHATAYLMAELFEQHDREKFELVAFSFGIDSNDEMRQRIRAAFDRFVDVRNQSSKEIALLARNLGIDIAIDLKGFTQNSRPGIFCYRVAPVQVNYLGYPGTMGADYMDYLIADQALIPEVSQAHYSEKIVYLPNSYQVNAKRKISDRVFTRAELGLPASGFVFCCFNNNYKITPHNFDSWMRILSRVDGSVLWLLEDSPAAASNLRMEARQRGVSPERIVFGQRMPLPEHLARHRAADLFIDTLPCNAHTTASDALWAGLPVLTCMGEAFASRVAASLLIAIGLPELITATQEDYEAMAVELATNPQQVQSIKQKLECNRLTTPLFDTKLFSQHIEEAYVQMVERCHAGLAPQHIFIGQSKLKLGEFQS